MIDHGLDHTEQGIAFRVIRGGRNQVLGGGAEPGRDHVGGGGGARTVGVGFPLLVLHFERGAHAMLLQEFRLPARCGELAPVVIEGRILLIIFLVIQQRHAESQFLVRAVVDAQRSANAAINSVAGGDGGLVLAQDRIVDAIVDDTGAAAVAVQNRIGPALNIDAGDVVPIPGNIGDEKIAGVVRRIETTHPGGLVGRKPGRVIIQCRPIAQAAKVTAGAADFGAGHVLQQRLIVRGTDVAHEFLRRDRDRGADILKLGADAGAAQGIRSLVANIVAGADFKRTEDDHIFVFVRLRRNRSGGLRGQRPRAGEQGQHGQGLSSLVVHSRDEGGGCTQIRGSARQHRIMHWRV